MVLGVATPIIKTGNWKLDLLIILFIVLMNAFFVMAEFSMVSTNVVKLRNAPGISYLKKLAINQLKEIDFYLASCQLGITIASLALGWIGEPALSEMLVRWLEGAGPLKVIVSHLMAVIIAFTLITSFHIVLGEQVPKLVAITSPELYLILIALPLEIFTRLFYPLIKALQIATAIVAKLLRLEVTTEGHSGLTSSVDELRALLEEVLRRGVISEAKGRMLQHILDLERLTVLDVLVPRTDVVAIPLGTRLETFIDIVHRYKHSRYPVYKDSLDEVVGILHVKDVIALLRRGLTQITEKVLRKPLFLPETTNLFNALSKMRERRLHMAIVLDEYGGTKGIVTMEDIIEYIVGELSDEFDLEIEEKVIRESDSSYLVRGNLSLVELKERTGIDLQELAKQYGDFSTLGGLVFGLLGRQPERGDRIELNGYLLEVYAVRGVRVWWVRILIKGGTESREG